MPEDQLMHVSTVGLADKCKQVMHIPLHALIKNNVSF